MIAKLYGSALYGVEAFRITIEVSVSNGMGYMITGLPDDAVKESLTRIAIALDHYGLRMPRTKLVINLSPADIPKSGTGFDLPIAIGILLASGAIEDLNKLKDYWIIGELGLDGSVLPVRGVLCMAIQAKKEGIKGLLLPAANAEEAALSPESTYMVSGICKTSLILYSSIAHCFRHYPNRYPIRRPRPILISKM